MNNLEKDKDLNEEIQENQTKQSDTPPQKKSRKRKKVQRGFFGTLIYIADCISKAIQNGILGFLFVDLYIKLNDLWKRSFIYQFFAKLRRKARSRAMIAHLYESTPINRVISRIGKLFINTYMRALGVGIFSFACSSVIMELLIYYTDINTRKGDLTLTLTTSAIVAVISLPMLISRRKIGESLLESRLGKYIVHQLLSLDESKLEIDKSIVGGGYLGVFEIGMIIGFVTLFIDPWIMVCTTVILLSVVIVMCFPEIGLMMILVAIPLTGHAWPLLIMIAIVFISFLFKFIRGKRIMRFELIDVFVVLFGLIIIASCFYTEGGIDSILRACAYLGLMSIYFIIVNIYIRKTWISRAFRLVCIITTIMSVFAIAHGGLQDPSWMDATVYSNIHSRIALFFDNPNLLGVYLITVLPFALANLMREKKVIEKSFYAICFGVITVAVIFTYSRSAWLGMIVGLIIFFLTYNFRNLWGVLITASISLPALYYLLPRDMVNRFIYTFIGIFNPEYRDSSMSYRIDIWDTVIPKIKDHLLGIGIGEHAFWNVFPQYAESGATPVWHSHNLYLQIILELGIVGIIMFAILMFMFSQKCFGVIKQRQRGEESRALISAGLASISGALVAGLADHVWFNNRVFLIFWIVFALTIALTKMNEREQLKAQEAARVDRNSRSAEIDLQY